MRAIITKHLAHSILVSNWNYCPVILEQFEIPRDFRPIKETLRFCNAEFMMLARPMEIYVSVDIPCICTS